MGAVERPWGGVGAPSAAARRGAAWLVERQGPSQHGSSRRVTHSRLNLQVEIESWGRVLMPARVATVTLPTQFIDVMDCAPRSAS